MLLSGGLGQQLAKLRLAKHGNGMLVGHEFCLVAVGGLVQEELSEVLSQVRIVAVVRLA